MKTIEIESIFKLIKEKLWIDNIIYCICGSGLKYEECCKINNKNSMGFIDENIEKFLLKWNNIIKKTNPKQYKEAIKKELYWELKKYWRLKCTCIHPYCKNKPIWSHLIPKWFIKILQNEKYNFRIDWIEKKLWKDSFKIDLWCKYHDWFLFQKTDNIKDISILFDVFDNKNLIGRDELIWEFFLKTLSFKAKTVILDQMYWFVLLIFHLIEKKENFNKILEFFIKNYEKYHKVLSSFDNLFVIGNWKKTINIPSFTGNHWKILNCYDTKKVFYQTNIKIFWNVPIFIINIVKNWNRVYFLWCTVWDSIDKWWKQILEKINSEISVFKKNDDFLWVKNYFEKLVSLENIYFLDWKIFFWNTYIYWEK